MSLQVTSSGYYRDPITGAILNTDNKEYQKILTQRHIDKKARETEMRLSKLEQGIGDIKDLLQQLIGKQNV